MSGRWRPAVSRWWRRSAIVGRRRRPAIVGRRRRPSIGRRRTFDIAWAHLDWPAGITDYPPCRVQDRLTGPVTVRRVKRLRVASVDHIAGRSRSKDGARYDGAAHDTGGNAPSPSRASPAPCRASPAPSRTFPAPSRTFPAAAPPLGGNVRRGGQGRSDHRSCEHRDDLAFQLVTPTGVRCAVWALARTETSELDFFRCSGDEDEVAILASNQTRRNGQFPARPPVHPRSARAGRGNGPSEPCKKVSSGEPS